MGFVYRADDRHLHAPVVIKVPRRAMLDDPQFVERFQREIRSLVTLSHPHIVKIIDVGQHEGVPFAVMQYMDGSDLEARRPRDAEGHPLAVSPTALRDWLPEVAGALDFVHRKGYVHRDMKPGNVLFDRERHAYLSDFGVAKVVREAGSDAAEMTGTGMILGTPEYMAPELVLGQEVTGRVDQYALAVTVYELLAARRPFEGPTPGAIHIEQANKPVPALHNLRPSVPKALSSVVARALSNDPAARYATCREFTDAVLATIASAGGGASSKSTAERIYLSCPTCERRLRVTSQNAGSLVGCPGCQARLRVAADLSRLTVSQSAPAPADRPVTKVEQHAVRRGPQTMVETPDVSPPAARRSRTLLEPSHVETATSQEKIDTPTEARSPSITIPLPQILPWAVAGAATTMLLLSLLLVWVFHGGGDPPGETRDSTELSNLASGQSRHTEGQERPRQEPSSSEGKPKSTDEPIEKAQRSDSQTPLDAEGYYNRGRACYVQGKLDEAIADYNTAIQLNPDYAKAYNSRGRSYYDQGKLDEAIADYTKAIRIDPNVADTYYSRGRAYDDDLENRPDSNNVTPETPLPEKSPVLPGKAKTRGYFTAFLPGYRAGVALQRVIDKPDSNFANRGVIFDGLMNPTGVAIQPETGAVFVSDSAAGRVLRIVDENVQEVITGYLTDANVRASTRHTVPVGLVFLSKNRLVVADATIPDGAEYLRVFQIPTVDAVTLGCNECLHVAATDTTRAGVNSYAVATTDTALYVTCNGDNTKGWISKSDIRSASFGDLTRFITTKEATGIDSPVAITISPRGELVVGQMGAVTVPYDALLSFYDARDGRLLYNEPTGLHDIIALTYSPKGHLYALDFAWTDLSQGGLFRLDNDGAGGVNAVKIASLDKPTAMAFGTDGSLYITLIGAVADGQEVGVGQLVRLDPGL
jgi:serine/threonine protein kinase